MTTIYVGQVQGSVVLSDGRRLFCSVELSAYNKARQATIEFTIGSEVIAIPSEDVTVCLPDGRTGPFTIVRAYRLQGAICLDCEQSPNWKGWTDPAVEATAKAPETGPLGEVAYY